MAHIGFICPPLQGHINPMSVLARELRRRGHSVVFIGLPDMAAKLPADLPFASYGECDHPPGSLNDYLRRLSRLGSLVGVRGLIRHLANFADTTCRDLPRCLDRLRPDALVIDQTDPAASVVARAVGVPFANVANALPMNPEASVPPPVLGWSYDPTPPGVRRNLGGYRIARLVERPITEVIRRHALSFGLQAIRYPHETWSDRCQLTQCIAALDFPRQELPKCFHYVGPLRGPEEPADFELPQSDRPLVFCSLGTLQGSRAALVRRISAAAADLGVDLLIAHGGLLDRREVEALPGNPNVAAMVPQRAVLRRSAVAVTHCGFNTVLDSLSCGTPMVGLPIAFEQPATGARLSRAGSAQIVNHCRSRRRIRDALEKVLIDPKYRGSSATLAEEIRRSGGVTLAANLLERSFGLRAQTEAATTAPRARDDVRGDTRSGSR